MAELVLHDLEVGAGLVGDGRGGVAQVVQPDRRHVVETAQQHAEAAADVGGVDRQPVFADEQVAGVVPWFAGGQAPGPLLQLPGAVLAQDLHGVGVEGDGAGAGGGLGRSFHDLVAGGRAVADDEQHPAVEVDIRPAQPARFAAA